VPQHPRMNLGQAIAVEIERRDIYQREAAEQIGVTQQVLSRWIHGQNTPKAEHIPAIARFLGVPQAEVKRMREPRPRADRRTLDRLEAVEKGVDEIRQEIDRLTRLLEGLAGSPDAPRRR
jgi:transcriptional regulator with XRE-family HTH domain